MKDALVGVEYLADLLDLSDGSHQHGDANAPGGDEVAARDGSGELAFTPCQLLTANHAGHSPGPLPHLQA